jgi:hypothetical protein
MRMLRLDGSEADIRTVFHDCREFQAESEVHFSAPTSEPAKPVLPHEARPPLPGDLDVELRLETTIDTDTAAAGDPISATVVRDVHRPRSKEVLIPAGATVHGRVTGVQRRFVPADSVFIGLSLQSVEFGGESMPFAARVRPVDLYQGYQGPFHGDTRSFSPHTPVGPVSSFSFPNERRHVLTAGTTWHWETIAPSTSR